MKFQISFGTKLYLLSLSPIVDTKNLTLFVISFLQIISSQTFLILPCACRSCQRYQRQHVIHVKDTPHEINQILRSLYDYRNTQDSWDSCTMCFSFFLSVNIVLLYLLNQCKHVTNMCINIQPRIIPNGVLSLHK